MPVTKWFRRYWRLSLAVAAMVAVIACGAALNTVYAAEKGPEAQKEVLPPTLTVTLLDEDGQPVGGVEVHAMPGNLAGKEKRRARTDENGKAVFKHLKSGAYYFYADVGALRSHDGYDFPAIIKETKRYRSFFISETGRFDLSQDAECTFTIKRSGYIMLETFLDVYKPDKIVLMNKQMGIGQNITIGLTDFIQIYLPMGYKYQIVTVKDGDFDSWIIEFYAHDCLRIELL
jgi:hypothetical protein